MKIKFLLLTLTLLFARGCDFYSTSKWINGENGINDEMNPLTQIFGMNWNGLILTNTILIGLIIWMSYYYHFNYKRKFNFDEIPKNYKEYISLLYYGKLNSFVKVFYKIPRDRKVLLGHLGYILIRVTIIASLLAAIHNTCQYNGYEIYNEFRNLVGRPLYVIYGLILISGVLISRKLFISEFKEFELSQGKTNSM